jgi:type IV pilus assembly protein PilA
MSFNNIKTKLRQERGFTIVELLIVIVVIGILAAITIVSFNGVTTKANTSNASSNAEAVQKVAESYNADNSSYPSTIANFTAAANTVKLPGGVTIMPSPATGASLTTTNGKTNIVYQYKGTAGSATGGRIYSLDFGNTGVPKVIYVGDATSTDLTSVFTTPS